MQSCSFTQFMYALFPNITFIQKLGCLITVNISGSQGVWGLISEKPWICHWLEFATSILSFIIRANELKEFSNNLFVSMFFHHKIACLFYFLPYHCLFFRVCNLFTACMHTNTVLRDILRFFLFCLVYFIASIGFLWPHHFYQTGSIFVSYFNLSCMHDKCAHCIDSLSGFTIIHGSTVAIHCVLLDFRCSFYGKIHGYFSI